MFYVFHNNIKQQEQFSTWIIVITVIFNCNNHTVLLFVLYLINAALVNRRHFFQKHVKTELFQTTNACDVMWNYFRLKQRCFVAVGDLFIFFNPELRMKNFTVIISGSIYSRAELGIHWVYGSSHRAWFWVELIFSTQTLEHRVP